MLLQVLTLRCLEYNYNIHACLAVWLKVLSLLHANEPSQFQH